MPTTKNVLARYVYLDKLLSDRYHYYDRKTLAEKVNEMLEADGYKTVDKRTIEYDIIDLEDAFFTIDCRENYELIRELCSFGKDLLVLKSNGDVKDLVVRRIKEMYDEYVVNRYDV